MERRTSRQRLERRLRRLMCLMLFGFGKPCVGHFVYVYGFMFIGPFDFVRLIRSSVSFRSRDETRMEVLDSWLF